MQKRVVTYTYMDEKGKEQKRSFVGTPGAYQKADNTLVLEEIMRDLMNPALNCQFKYLNGKLLLEVQDKKQQPIKTHDLVLLFQTHLTHIKIDSEFLKFFINRCNQFKRVVFDKPNKFEQSQQKKFYDNEFKRILREKREGEKTSAEEEYKRTKVSGEKTRWDQLMEELPAYEYAVSAYTKHALDAKFNPFLRGFTSFASSLDDRTLQEHLFYLFGAHVLHAAFQSEILHTGNVTAYRIEQHPRAITRTLPLIRDASLAAENKTNTFIAYVPSFTSTSEEQLEMTVVKDQKDEPSVITNDETVQFIVYQFPDTQQRSVAKISLYHHEKEIVLPPGMFKFTIETSLDGMFIIVKAEPVAPLEAEKLFKKTEEGRLLHALEYAFEHFYSKKYQDIKAGEQDFECVINNITIFKNNHGLAHAGRQARNVEDVLKLILKFGTPDAKKICEQVLNNIQLVEIARIAMVFYSSGRENEDQARGYLDARERARKRFLHYMETEYPRRNQLDPQAKKFIDICAFCLEFTTHAFHINKAMEEKSPIEALRANPAFASKPDVVELLKRLSNEDMRSLYVMNHVLVESHNLDSIRFQFSDNRTPRKLFNNMLFNSGLIAEDAKTPEFQESMTQLWTNVIARVQQTGDRLYDETAKEQIKDYDAMFAEVSLNPRKCAEILGLDQDRTPILLCDPEKPTVSDETRLQVVYYLLRNLNDYPKKIPAQINQMLKKDSPLFGMLAGGIRFLAEKREMKQTEEENELNKQIQQQCFLQLIAEIKKWSAVQNETLKQFLENPNIKTLLNWTFVNQLSIEKSTQIQLVEFYLQMDQASDYRRLSRFLKDYKLDISQMVVGGYTPLEYAFFNGNGPLALFLLEKHKVKVTKESLKLFFANPMLTSNDKLLSQFIKNPPMPLLDLLKIAFENTNDTNVIQSIAKKLTESQIFDAVLSAVQAGNQAALKVLLKMKFESNQKDEQGRTVLHHAAMTKNFFIVRIVTEALPKLATAKDKDGNTPLHLFLMNAKEEDIKTYGLDIIDQLQNAMIETNNSGMTPFDVLLRNQNLSHSYDPPPGFCTYAIDRFIRMDAPFNLQHCFTDELLFKMIVRTIRYESKSNNLASHEKLKKFANKEVLSHITDAVKCYMLDEINFFSYPATEMTKVLDDIYQVIIKSPSEEKKATPDNPQANLASLRLNAERIKFDINQLMPTINPEGNVDVSMALQKDMANKLSNLVQIMASLKLAVKQAYDFLLQPGPPNDLKKLISSTENSLTGLLRFLNKQTTALTETLLSKENVSGFFYADPSRTLSVFYQTINSRLQIYDKVGPEYYFTDNSLEKPTAESLVAFLTHLNSDEQLREEIARCRPNLMGDFYRAFSILPEFKDIDIAVKAKLIIVDIMQPDEKLKPSRFGLFAQKAGLLPAAELSSEADAKAQPAVTKKP